MTPLSLLFLSFFLSSQQRVLISYGQIACSQLCSGEEGTAITHIILYLSPDTLCHCPLSWKSIPGSVSMRGKVSSMKKIYLRITSDVIIIPEEVFPRPKFLRASVIHGYNRGSKELGIPTANLSMEELGDKGDIPPGIYFGFARLNSRVYEAVVSVGWNPFYKNTLKTIEAHLLSKLDDFYGESLEVLLCGFLREEQNFNSLGSHFLPLISTLN